MSIEIFDGMSVVRARLERDLNRFSIRNWLMEIDASPSLQLWAWDGAHNKKLRQADYPPYKTNREPADVSIYEGIKFFRRGLMHTKAVQIEVPGYEADDVIAALAGKAAGGVPVTIHSRDGDLRQLCVLADNITCTAEKKDYVEDCELRLYKTFVGDTSDFVKGVKLFGKEAWKVCDKDALLAIVHATELTDAMLEALPKPSHRQWVKDNHDVLKAMWKVVGFYAIPHDTLNANMVVGKSNREARDAVLKEFFL